MSSFVVNVHEFDVHEFDVHELSRANHARFKVCGSNLLTLFSSFKRLCLADPDNKRKQRSWSAPPLVMPDNSFHSFQGVSKTQSRSGEEEGWGLALNCWDR